MRKIFYIAFKDVRRTFRDIPALATMLAAPLIIALVLGSAFGGSKGFSIAPTKVVVVNLDAARHAGRAGGQIGDSVVATLTEPRPEGRAPGRAGDQRAGGPIAGRRR